MSLSFGYLNTYLFLDVVMTITVNLTISKMFVHKNGFSPRKIFPRLLNFRLDNT